MTIKIENWEKNWELALDSLRAELPPSSFNTCFNNARATSYTDGCLTLGAANLFVKTYIENNHREVLTAAVAAAFGAEVTVKIEVSSELYRARIRQRAVAEDTAVGGCLPVPEKKVPLFSSSGASFTNFIAGRCNEFALAAAKQAVQCPGEFSPLVLYGGHGLGKTHLLHAICHEASIARPSVRIICQTAESFVRAFSRAVVDKRLLAFRERYENCDLLAIDDFHTLGEGSKLATQKEFTQILEQLLQRKAQVVIAAAAAPNAIENLHRPLYSRLRQGLLARVDPLDDVTRRAIVTSLSADLSLTADLREYLGGIPAGEVREIEGILKNLRLRASLSAAPLSLAAVQEFFDTPEAPREQLPAAEIIAAVAYIYNIAAVDITGKKRMQSVVQARRAAAHLCRHLTSGSLSEIGVWLGGRSHATVLALLKQPPFASGNALEKQKFAAVLARLGVPAKIEDFVADRQSLLFD